MGNCSSSEKSSGGSGTKNNSRLKSAPSWIGGAPKAEAEDMGAGGRGSSRGRGALPCFLADAGPTGPGSSVARQLQLQSGDARLRCWLADNLGCPFVIAEKQTSRWGIECRVVCSSRFTMNGELDVAPQELQVMSTLRSLSKRKHIRSDRILYTDCAEATVVSAPANKPLLLRASEAGQEAIKAGAHTIATGRSARCAEIYEVSLMELLEKVSVLGTNPVSALGTALVRCDFCALRSDSATVHSLCSTIRHAFDQVQAQAQFEGEATGALRAAVAVEKKRREHVNELLQEAASIYFKKLKAERKKSKGSPSGLSGSFGVSSPGISSGLSSGLTDLDEHPDAPDDFLCPITLTLMRSPVRTPGGIVYERDAIISWLAGSPTCPFTRSTLAAEDLTPDSERQGQIDTWLSERRTNASGLDGTPLKRDGSSFAGAAAAQTEPTPPMRRRKSSGSMRRASSTNRPSA